MPSVSKTLGPLHFEDLEPKRFEDLNRQLVYDFRKWRRLEATGRAGSDDGFDARAYEIVGEDPPQTDEEDSIVVGANDRLWLIQCKRERTITPKKLMEYLDDIKLTNGEKLHGIVFTAACDFSKAARDQFRDKCVSLGIVEWYLWGKAELEDQLFQSKNDSLLFAYFGVSLTIRRRTQRADLRAKLVMKRKAHRVLGAKVCMHFLLRSPDASEYPYVDDIAGFQLAPQWVLRQYVGMKHAGLTFLTHRYFAFLSDDGKQWDAAKAVNDASDAGYRNPWPRQADNSVARASILEFWDKLPKRNRAWFEVTGLIPFEEILEIDELGDDIISEPHIYVPFDKASGPFRGFYAEVESLDSRKAFPESADFTRVKIFPDEFREPPPLGKD